jgi:alkylation response protein AidB-like acyl-CoA dehydrogenase
MNATSMIPALEDSASLKLAEGLGPRLREWAPIVDEQRSISPEVVETLKASGLLRIANPAQYGGSGEFARVLPVIAEIARASGSVGWCYSQWLQHNWMVGLWPEDAQAEFFADGPDVVCSSALMPFNAHLTPDGDAYRLTGSWVYSSGSDRSEWFMLGAQLAGAPTQYLLVTRSDCEITDTWFSHGLKGTGSNDIDVIDAVVPAWRVLAMPALGAGRTADHGPRVASQLGFYITQWPLINLVLPYSILGMAQGAVDAFGDKLKNQAGGSGAQVDERCAGGLRLAEASAEVDSARALCGADLLMMAARAREGADLTIDERLRCARNRAYSAKLCVQAVTRLFEASGAGGLADGSTLQRCYRDVHAGSHHRLVQWDAWATAYGRGQLGLEVELPSW